MTAFEKVLSMIVFVLTLGLLKKAAPQPSEKPFPMTEFERENQTHDRLDELCPVY